MWQFLKGSRNNCDYMSWVFAWDEHIYVHLLSIYSTEQNRWVITETKKKYGEHIGEALEN